MTDRANALTVVLDKDYRDDDIESLVNAIKQFKGVIDVSLNISNSTDHIAQMRAKVELKGKIYDVLKEL